MNFVRQLIDSLKGLEPNEAIHVILEALDEFNVELVELLHDDTITPAEYFCNLNVRATQASIVIEIIRRTNNDDSYHAIQLEPDPEDTCTVYSAVIH